MTPHVPNGWRTVQLGELCDVCRGSSPRPIADQKYFEGGTIPWIKIADATKSGKFLYTTKEHVNEFGASFSRCLPKGSLIIAASGTLGYPQFLGVEGCAHDGWLIPSNFRGLDKHFLYYLFLWKTEFFYSSAYGAAIQNINTMILREMEITIPDLATQRKIARVLSAYDDLIENNTRRIAILEKMAQVIYREWFVDFRFPGYENAKFVDSPLGRIPEGWNPVSLSAVADVNARTIKKGQEPDEISYVDIASVSTGHIDAVQPMPFAESPGRARRIVRHGDVIWSTVRPNRRSYAVTLNPPENMIVSTGFAVISGTSVPFTYLYQTLTTDDFVGYLVNHATGSAYPAVNSSDFENAQIVAPPQQILDAFHEKTEPLLLARHCMAEKNKRLRDSRDLLLPKLISGQLDVEQLDIQLAEVTSGREA